MDAMTYTVSECEGNWLICYHGKTGSGQVAQMIDKRRGYGVLVCVCVAMNTAGYKATNDWTKLI